MRYVVYGAGAVGGVVGARLHRAGIDVTLVARGDHLEALRTAGLTLESPQETLTLDVHAVGGAAGAAWADGTVVLLAVKSHQTPAALDDLATHAPPSTPVVCLQNGVANEPATLRRFADVHGICVMLPSGHVRPGVVVQRCHPTPGILDVGRFPSGVDATTRAVASDLRSAGFASEPRSDIMAWKHRKLLLNLGNAVQACCGDGDDADALAALATQEGERVLAKAGVGVVTADADRERRGDLLRPGTRPPDIGGGSTWQSVARGTDVETDYLTGEVVLLGRLHGVPTPVNDLLQRVTHELVRSGAHVGSIDAASLLDRLK